MTRVDKPKITIIIPVYNGAYYLEETLCSLKKQTFKEFEVICVDDGSSDDSMEMLKSFSNKDSRFRVFQTPENLGSVPRVINYASKFIQGEYFAYSSQDDLFSDDWLASMYQRAVDTDADATIPELVFFTGKGGDSEKKIYGLNGDKNIVLTGRDACYYSLDWTIPGNALWKSWLIKRFQYFDFSMNADEFTARFYYLMSNKVVFSNGTFFYRKNNPNAITVKLSNGSFDIPYTDYKLWLLVKESNLFSVDVEARTLKRAIRGLLHYYPFTYSRNFKKSRAKCTKLFKEMQEAGVIEWIEKNQLKGLFFERFAMRTYLNFLFCSLLGWLFKRAKTLLIN